MRASRYARNCLAAGKGGKGTGNVPSGSMERKTRQALLGRIFWFITKEARTMGMP